MRMTSYAVLAAAAVFSASSAHADTVVVTNTAGTPSATKWGTLPSENNGTAAVTGTVARSGNGSVELTGDLTRLQIGYQYAPLTTNLMPLKSVTGLSFDWRIAGDSVSGYDPDYTPALRLLIQDGNQRSSLIWEGANNGTYDNTTRDTWYSSSFSDTFYQNVAGSGVTLNNGSQVNQTLASWIANNYSANAFVSGISVGNGSGALPTYHAFVDNVTLGTINGDITYNFELAATSAVPEPASWAMMIGGFGVVGGAMRRRRVTKALLRLA